MKVVIAGGSGFLGRALEDALRRRGDEVVILTRSPRRRGEAGWDGRTLCDWSRTLEGAGALVNLTGRSVNCRYTSENRHAILRSRTDSVRVLAEAVRRAAAPPPVWIQASSLAIYGNAGSRWCTEETPPGFGFGAHVCREWERLFRETALPGTRRVILRIGLVLDARAGFLQPLARLARLGLGGRTGSGRQYVSWLHREDMNRLFLAAIDDADMSGVYNAAAPNPVSNAQLMRSLRRHLHRPWSPPVPPLLARIGAFFMRTEADLALTGRRASPARLEQQGFWFVYPQLDQAFTDLLNNPMQEIQ